MHKQRLPGKLAVHELQRCIRLLLQEEHYLAQRFFSHRTSTVRCGISCDDGGGMAVVMELMMIGLIAAAEA